MACAAWPEITSLANGRPPPEAAAARIARPLDRMEMQGEAFHARVREGFLAEAARSPNQIVVDASGSMKFAGAGESKIQYARRIAASLAYLLVNQGDAAGLSVCHDSLHLEIPPSRRPAHLQHVFDTLATLAPGRATGLVDALHTIAEKISQRALVVVLSDLFTDTDAFGRALQHLRYRKHDVSVFHLMDPQEIAFDFERPQRFVDLEDGTAIVAEPVLIAEEYRRALDSFLAAVRDRCHDARADYQLVTTDRDYEELLREFLTTRLPKRGRR